MMQDYLDPRNAEGMPNLADSTFAMDFLLSVKKWNPQLWICHN